MTDTTLIPSANSSHPAWIEVQQTFERLLKDVGRRKQALEQIHADSQEAARRLFNERQNLLAIGYAKEAARLEPSIRSHQDVMIDVGQKLKALHQEFLSIQETGSHPEMVTARMNARLAEGAALREKQTAEYHAAQAAFEKLVTPEVQTAAAVKAAAERVVAAARVIGVAPSPLAKTVAHANPTPAGSDA
jgi:hypothetical protein